MAELNPKIQIKKSYIVESLQGPEELVTRLFDLGFYKQAEIVVLGRAPFSGPYIFQVNQNLIALRSEEVQCLKLKPLL